LKATAMGRKLDSWIVSLPAAERRRVKARTAELIAEEMSLRDLCKAMKKTQVAIARRRADSVSARLQAGAPFDSLARASGDPNEAKLAEAVGIAQLPPEYSRVVGADSTLGLKPVFIVGEGTERPKFVIMELTQRLAAGDMSFEDVKDQVRQRLSQDLAIKHYLDQLRRQTYIDIRL